MTFMFRGFATELQARLEQPRKNGIHLVQVSRRRTKGVRARRGLRDNVLRRRLCGSTILSFPWTPQNSEIARLS